MKHTKFHRVPVEYLRLHCVTFSTGRRRLYTDIHIKKIKHQKLFSKPKHSFALASHKMLKYTSHGRLAEDEDKAHKQTVKRAIDKEMRACEIVFPHTYILSPMMLEDNGDAAGAALSRLNYTTFIYMY